MSRLLVVGSSNTDFVFGCDHLPEPGETLASSSFEVFAGGKGANQAVAAARAGGSVWFAGCCGDDQNGSDRLVDLRAAGVEVDYVAVRQGVPSGLAFITVDRTGENSIVTFDGANQYLGAADVRALIEDLHPQYVATTLEPSEDTVKAALKAAREVGALTIVTAAPFSTFVVGCAKEIDVLIANKGEAIQLLENTGAREKDADDVARQLAIRLKSIVIMSMGSDGAVLASPDRSTSISAVPVDVVDTTGAGDALSGTFAAWLASGADIDTAVRAGVVAGSLATSASGAQSSFPTRDLIEKVMARQTLGA